MDTDQGDGDMPCWLLQDLEVQDEIEIDHNPFENNLILVPQSTFHSDQSLVTLSADALAEGSSNEELLFPFPLLDDSSNDTSNPGDSTSIANCLGGGSNVYVPRVFEGVECSEIASEIDGNVYSFLSSPQFQCLEPFQFSLEGNVVASNMDSDPRYVSEVMQLEDMNTKTKISNFVSAWSKLAAKAQIIKDRTGAVTNVKTIFKEEHYEIKTENERSRGRTVSTSSGCNGTAYENQRDSKQEDKDDHCYAAVIIKQRESSPSVRDHQYNQSCPRKKVKLSSESFPSEPKLPFFRTKSHREKMLVKYMNSLFLKASKLEGVSGNKIEIAVSYEEQLFTNENYKVAQSLLKQKPARNRVSRYYRRLSVSSESSSEHENCVVQTDNEIPTATAKDNPIGKEPKPQVKVTVFKQPASEMAPAGVNVKFIWDKKHSCAPSNIVPEGFIDLDTNNSVSPDNAIVDHTASHPNNLNLNKGDDLIAKGADVESTSSYIPETASDSEITDASSPPSVSISCHGQHVDDSENHLTSTASNFESNKLFPDTNDAETNTEPICGNCSSHQRPSAASTSSEVFWIRCAHPLCYFLVHPDCIGFRVSSTAQLELLPPFRCTLHRN